MKKLNPTKKMNKKQIEELLKDEGVSKSEKMRELFETGLDSVEIAKLLKVRTNFTYNILNQYILQLEVKGEQVDIERKRKDNTVKDRVLELLKENPELTNKELQIKLKILYPNQIYQSRKKLISEGLISK